MKGVDGPRVVKHRHVREGGDAAPAVRPDHDPVLLVDRPDRRHQLARERVPQLVLALRRHRLVQQLEDDVWLAFVTGGQHLPESELAAPAATRSALPRSPERTPRKRPDTTIRPSILRRTVRKSCEMRSGLIW